MEKILTILYLVTSYFAFGQVSSSPLPTPKEDKYKLPVDINKIYDYPEKMPQFPEGMIAFRQKFTETFVSDSVKIENNERTQKGMISFVVERDGTITNVQTTGSNDSFNTEVTKAIRSIKDKWEPAVHKDVIVRCKFLIPLTMNIP